MLRVLGPARVSVASGALNVLGAILQDGGEFYVSEHRSYSLKALEDVEINVSLGEGSRIERADPVEEPLDDWTTIADSVIDGCRLPCTIVVVGPVEAGKTSMTALVANRALSRGIPAAIIDADIGQADIGPPGFISLAVPEDWVLWLRDLWPSSMRFVGSIEPAPVAGRLLSMASVLVREAIESGAGVVIVDTDGWVEGWGALEFKADLIRVLNTDAVIVMGDIDLYKSFHRMLASPVYYARSPIVRAVRNRVDRRLLRSSNYKRFLSNASIRLVDAVTVSIHGSCLFSSTPYNDPELKTRVEGVVEHPVVYIGRFPGGHCVVVDSDSPPDPATMRELQKRLEGDILVLFTGGFRGVLVGVSDGSRDYPGIVEDVYLDGLRIKVRTPYDGPIRGLVFGRIRLIDFQEDSKRRVWI